MTPRDPTVAPPLATVNIAWAANEMSPKSGPTGSDRRTHRRRLWVPAHQSLQSTDSPRRQYVNHYKILQIPAARSVTAAGEVPGRSNLTGTAWAGPPHLRRVLGYRGHSVTQLIMYWNLKIIFFTLGELKFFGIFQRRYVRCSCFGCYCKVFD